MVTAADEMRVRPHVGWYAVPAVLWVIALTLFVVSLIAIAHIVNAGVDRLRGEAGGAEVTVPSDGLTFYGTDADGAADCSLVSPGGSSTPLESLSVPLKITSGGPTYYALGVTPDDLPPGTYTVTCTDLPAGSRLGTGPRVDVTAMATRALWGLVLPLILGIAGLVVLVVLVVKRHSARSRIRTLQAYAANGRRPSWSQPQSSGGPPPPPPPPPRG